MLSFSLTCYIYSMTVEELTLVTVLSSRTSLQLCHSSVSTHIGQVFKVEVHGWV